MSNRSIELCLENPELHISVSGALVFLNHGALLGEDPQDELSGFIGIEGRRDDDIGARRKLEALRDLAEIDERLRAARRPGETEEIGVQRPGHAVRILEVVEGKAHGERVETFVPHGSPPLLHDGDDDCAVVLIVIFVGIGECDPELWVGCKGGDEVSASARRSARDPSTLIDKNLFLNW